jgi:hypothetical protein
VPYCVGLTIGIVCVALIALVLVKFDAQTTEQWLLASVLSVCIRARPLSQL